MRHGCHLPLLLTLIVGIGLGGCRAADDPNNCIGEPAIVPGVGVRTADGQWCLDAPASAIDQAVGAAQSSWNLGVVGHRAAYPGHHLTALYSSGDDPVRLTAIYLDEGVAVQTGGGVGLGSDGNQVRAEFGEPVIDPFLGLWWYRDQGIALTLTDDRVTRIQLFRAPAPGE